MSLARRQAFEQYLTSAHWLAHLRRHSMIRPHRAQCFARCLPSDIMALDTFENGVVCIGKCDRARVLGEKSYLGQATVDREHLAGNPTGLLGQ